MAAVVIVTSMGCAHAVLLSQLPPADQAKYKGTEPGWHVLSPYFAVEIKPNSRAWFYHYRDPQNPKLREKIGGEYMYWPSLAGWSGGLNQFGPPENAYAVSQDGRSLLYFREPVETTFRALFRARPLQFPAELHLYRHGVGDSLIVGGVDHFGSGPPAPAGAVIYSVRNGAGLVRGPIVSSIAEFVPQ